MSAYDPRAGLYLAGPAFGLPRPAPPATSAEELELLVRFEHPAKFLAVLELPGAALLGHVDEARAYGCDPDAARAIRAGIARQVGSAATELLAEPGTRGALRALGSGPVVALGDSITDDLISWAEIMRACCAQERPSDVTVVNAGVSGDTTADALRRLYGVVAAEPTLVVAMLGTNDCQRHGPGADRLVSAEDGRRNVAAISRWLHAGGAEVVWLTPPPVHEPALAAAVGDRPFSLRDEDVASLGASLRATGDRVIDTGAALRAGDPRELLLADGVHPSLAGQLVIARTLLRALAAGPKAAGPARW